MRTSGDRESSIVALVLLNGYDLRPGGPILTGSYRRRATGFAVLISSGKPASVGMTTNWPTA